jgi:hypothetical protein
MADNKPAEISTLGMHQYKDGFKVHQHRRSNPAGHVSPCSYFPVYLPSGGDGISEKQGISAWQRGWRRSSDAQPLSDSLRAKCNPRPRNRDVSEVQRQALR